MKIKKITLFNVGPYSGINEFNIDCTNKEKNIILIGGKNGAGKTTFFSSLRVCIYGYRAYGYENTNQYYFDEVYKLINDNEKVKENGQASVELALLFDDGMDNNEYRIVRNWILNNKKIIESYHIFLNSKEIIGDELTDFENYLLHIIPPNLFKFYFFDGEKIGEFFLQNNQDNSFKNAFLTMTGYDNIELLIKNFKRNISNRTKDNSISNKYFVLQEEIENLSNEIIIKKEQYQSLTNQIIQFDDKIANAEKDYSKNGGLSIEKWQEINKEILLEENKREECHRLRKELANTEIPYIILDNKLKSLKKQIDIEDKINKRCAILEYINPTTLNSVFANSNLNNSQKQNVIEIICDFVDKKININENEKIKLGLSSQDKNEVLLQIDRHSKFDKLLMSELTIKIKESLAITQKLRKQLEKSNIDKYQEFINIKQDFLDCKSGIQTSLKEIDMDLFKLQTILETKQNEYKRVRKDYEEELKLLSVNDISSRALLALSGVSEQLLRFQIDKVENNFKKIFSKIINKKDFIDGIYIDEKLNIYPYKNTRYSKLKIEELLKSNSNIQEYVGKRGMEIIHSSLNDDKNYIDLPVEISSPFSQGEKQVYIMSIYFALMQISCMEVPFVIDTPFARIDKEHRTKIIKNFFTKLKGQVFILSTDEEINDEYMTKIIDNVSNKYLLEYVSRGKTRVLSDKYFGGGKQ